MLAQRLGIVPAGQELPREAQRKQPVSERSRNHADLARSDAGGVPAGQNPSVYTSLKFRPISASWSFR